jgi:hypothetical protein
MKTRILCGVICLAVCLLLPDSLLAGSRNNLPNDVSLELAGKCLLYSFSYQRMIAEPFALEAGLSLLGGGGSGESSTIFFYTVGAKVYFLQKDASPYIGAGYVGLSASTTNGPFSDSGSSGYAYVGPGFEYRGEGGFVIRGGVNGLIAGGSFFVWPAVAIGVAF